ncbi:hypothetical protein CEB3_c47660 [Peptococcaceae bacterium CEB3]|nr:hypothetical protein CEB3_c47660 [Peptococcaceae bacterium CEB3]
MKRKIRVPKSLKELFGEEQTPMELLITVIFSIGTLAIISVVTRDYWQSLKWYQSLVLLLLYIDISGGVVANLSAGTNQYYVDKPRMRWIFIAIHIQPLLLSWVLRSSITIALLVWGYTMLSTFLVNIFQGKAFQRTLAAALFGVAISFFFLMDFGLPSVISIIYIFYMFKLIYGFGVNHQFVSD